MRFFDNFMAGGQDQTTTNYYCRLCNFKVKFHRNIFFDTAARPLGRLILLTHSILRHWSIFSLRENLTHVGYAFLFLLLFLLLLPIDLLHGLLWLLTLPFWWLHELIA